MSNFPQKNATKKSEDKICIEKNCNEKAVAYDRCAEHKLLSYYYQVERNKPIKEQAWKKYTQKRKKWVFALFGSKCKICDEPVNWNLKKNNLQLHHKFYDDNRRTRYQDELDRARSAGIRAIIEAENHPERFELLCNDCHTITGFAKRCPLKLHKCDEYAISEGYIKLNE